MTARLRPSRPHRPARWLAARRHQVVGQVAVRWLAEERRDLAGECQDRRRQGPRRGRDGQGCGRPASSIDGVDCGSPAARPARYVSTMPGTGNYSRPTRSPTDPALFLNDLDISRNRVVVTDSINARVGGHPAAVSTASCQTRRRRSSCRSRATSRSRPGFNLNGIAARGGWMVMVQSGHRLPVPTEPEDGRHEADRHRRLSRDER